MMRVMLLVVVLALGVLAMTSCGMSSNTPSEGSFERGIAEYESEHWFDAVENLRLFLRRNPTDSRAPEAQYHIGMARFEDEDYPVASVEFEILRSDYPASEFVEEAWYMEGLCYVEQVSPVYLDQSITRRALDHFRRFMREFPNGAKQAEAREQIVRLTLHLDRKQFESVMLYKKLGKYKAAKISAEVMLRERSDSTLRPELLMLAGEIEESLENSDAARSHYAELMRDFPEHELADQAQTKWQELAGEAE